MVSRLAIFKVGNKKNQTKIQVMNKIKSIVFESVSVAMGRATEKHLPDVALRTGALRAAMARGLFKQLSAQVGKTKIDINISLAEFTNELEYLKYHWGVGPSGKPSYANPTTALTKPIKPSEWTKTIKREFKTEFVKRWNEYVGTPTSVLEAN